MKVFICHRALFLENTYLPLNLTFLGNNFKKLVPSNTTE